MFSKLQLNKQIKIFICHLHLALNCFFPSSFPTKTVRFTYTSHVPNACYMPRPNHHTNNIFEEYAYKLRSSTLCSFPPSYFDRLLLWSKYRVSHPHAYRKNNSCVLVMLQSVEFIHDPNTALLRVQPTAGPHRNEAPAQRPKK
jgi:hypothetical protein